MGPRQLCALVATDPDGPGDGRRLTDDAGRLLARFVAERHRDVLWADWFEPADGVATAAVVAGALRDLAGLRVSAPVALGRRLVAAGGRPGRHAHVMCCRLEAAVRAEWARDRVGDVRLVPVARAHASALVPAFLAAHGVGHPDLEPGEKEPAGAEGRIAGVLRGAAVGRLLGCSRMAVGPDGRVVGAALVTDAPGESPRGGPWVTELFRDPGHPGVGGALLRHALWLADGDGHAAVGLAVTEGNPARALYERTGFELVSSWLNVDLPAPPVREKT